MVEKAVGAGHARPLPAQDGVVRVERDL